MIPHEVWSLNFKTGTKCRVDLFRHALDVIGFYRLQMHTSGGLHKLTRRRGLNDNLSCYWRILLYGKWIKINLDVATQTALEWKNEVSPDDACTCGWLMRQRSLPSLVISTWTIIFCDTSIKRKFSSGKIRFILTSALSVWVCPGLGMLNVWRYTKQKWIIGCKMIPYIIYHA